jgi:hypothetical protein
MIPETGTLLIWFGGAALLFLGLVALLGTGRGHVTDRLATVSGESVAGSSVAGRHARIAEC